MNDQDRQAIEQLFGRLEEVERTAAPRDAQAEALIREHISRNSQSAYYMAQTIIVQQQALEEAERRLQARDDGFADAGDDFTSDRMRASGSGVPRAGQRFQVPNMPASQAQAGQPAAAGGGFLAGAAQTAVGVAGGVLLGSAIGSMLGLGSQPAQAAETPAPQPEPAQEPETEMADAGAESGEGGGFWDSLFGGGDSGGGDFGGGFGE
jgi:hypothetical protein